jgi:hypothetical protein
MKTKLFPALLSLAVMTLATVPAQKLRAAALTEKEALEIGIDAYIYGYPLVTMEMTRRVMTNVAEPEGTRGPMGQFVNARTYPTAAFRDITAPNADTLYSVAWLDLAKEPYVLSIPDEDNRYFLLPILSGWTDVFQVPGKRTTGTKAQQYVISGPHWQGNLPAGVTEYKSPTNMVWILGRTYCTGIAADYKAVHAIQDKYSVAPLSAYGKPYTPPKGVVDPKVDMQTPVRDQVNRLKINAYFNLLAALLKDNPPAAEDAAMVARIAELGLVPGKSFDIGALDPAAARALEGVPAAAIEKIMLHYRTTGTHENGWMFTVKTGQYGTDYLQRAVITIIGLGANRPQDAVYPVSEADADGQPYSGAKRYTMHFEKGRVPPADGFWSLTMYDANFFFVANPLDKQTVSPRNDLKYNADGSLDLYIQNESPGKEKEANWLPAPKEKFVLMLRMYWPQETPPSIIDGSWKIPPVKAATR